MLPAMALLGGAGPVGGGSIPGMTGGTASSEAKTEIDQSGFSTGAGGASGAGQRGFNIYMPGVEGAGGGTNMPGILREGGSTILYLAVGGIGIILALAFLRK